MLYLLLAIQGFSAGAYSGEIKPQQSFYKAKNIFTFRPFKYHFRLASTIVFLNLFVFPFKLKTSV